MKRQCEFLFLLAAFAVAFSAVTVTKGIQRGYNRNDSSRRRGIDALENEDHPGTPEKRDGSTYLQSTKDVNKNLLKRTTNYGNPAAKRSSDAWEKEAHQLKAQEMRGQFYQLSANEKRAVPPAVAEKAMEIGEKALEKQFEIMEQQQQKAGEFINKKLEIDIEPDKGWQTEDMFVPPGFHIGAEITGEDEKPEGQKGEQAFTYPMGIGGMIMNGCYGTNYQLGDPCYQAKDATTLCWELIDGAAFIGVGFDGRGDFSPESRKMSIIQRDCSGKATYDDYNVPDTMNVHGVYDTSATMQTFYSRQEYQTFIQRQAGMSGSAFGFYGGVKKAWGSSRLSGSQKYMARFSIDIDRYEIYLDEVKPKDLSVNFLQEFMDLPLSYLAPGAAVKFQDFVLRWGTHYIKSGKFGGRLQIFKTMEVDQVSSKAEFSQVMEAEFRSLFASFHAKSETKGGSSQKQQSKTSSTSISVEGGDQEIASMISDENSPTIKNEIKQWLESIRTFPKPFSFMVGPITDLLKFNPSSLFTNEERDWGCEGHAAKMKKDPDTGERYYEVKVNGTLIRKKCPYKSRDDLVYVLERRLNGLERAVGVYMEEGPLSVSDITLPAGKHGCQTDNFEFQKEAGKPTWETMTSDEESFIVIFRAIKKLSGTYGSTPILVSPNMEKYVKYFEGGWFVGDSAGNMDLNTVCNLGEGKDFKICILGLVLTYHPRSGYLTLAKEDFSISKKTFPSLTENMIDSLVAHAEWPAKHIFQLHTVVGYLPCNVKWSNAMRFDPSNKEGKCLHFTVSSKGTVFVIFAAIPNNKDTWYYLQISPYGVGIFKSQKLVVSTVDTNAVGLGADILYQSYFVCVKEGSESTEIEYGKSHGTTEFGDVYLTMIDRVDPLYVRFYSFGNGEEPMEVVDAHFISRHLTKANCRGDTVLDNKTNLCMQNCHIQCDPTQGCRRTASNKPLATDCNACRNVKNVITGECIEKCPEDWVEQADGTCKPKDPCADVKCLNGGSCKKLEDGNFKCVCVKDYTGEYCEHRECPDEALGMESGAISDSQISASSMHDGWHAASQGRLNFQETPSKSGGWVTGTKDKNQWLQVDLGNLFTKVKRVATQGRNYNSRWPHGAHKEWVTRYKLQYSDDGLKFEYYKEQGQPADKEFDGNTDQNTVVYHYLKPPIRARYVRFRPTAWHGTIAMRVELYGCQECQYPLVSGAKLTASSEYRGHPATKATISQTSGGGWAAGTADTPQWLQVDLQKRSKVRRVATKGYNGKNQYVKKYKLQFSDDGVNFQYYKEQGQTTDKEFVGNTNWNSAVYNDLKPPITARYIRFRPTAWNWWIAMRVEVYGCQLSWK